MTGSPGHNAGVNSVGPELAIASSRKGGHPASRRGWTGMRSPARCSAGGRRSAWGRWQRLGENATVEEPRSQFTESTTAVTWLVLEESPGRGSLFSLPSGFPGLVSSVRASGPTSELEGDCPCSEIQFLPSLRWALLSRSEPRRRGHDAQAHPRELIDSAPKSCYTPRATYGKSPPLPSRPFSKEISTHLHCHFRP